jgi:outer membrane lipoprotein carrier protein
MKMRHSIILFLLQALISVSSFAQDNRDALKILDKFSSNALGAPSVSMKFKLVNVDQMEKTTDTLTGSIILSKDKYQLIMPEYTVWFNGETSWSYLYAEKEVTITKPDKKDNSFQNRPSSIFSMYKKGYKTRLIEEKNNSYIIDLYPEDIKSDLLRVRLSIGSTLMDLKTLEYKKRDGIIITIYVSEYNLKQKPEPDSFIFPKDKYKGADINDMR